MKKHKADGQKLIIHIDGSSKGNPGPAAIGIVIQDEKLEILKEISEALTGSGIGKLTNNQAEYLAFIRALTEATKLGAQDVVINSDSELLVKQLKGEYKIKDENLKLLNLCAQFLISTLGREKIKINHIQREKNKEADRLAKKATEGLSPLLMSSQRSRRILAEKVTNPEPTPQS